MKTCMHTANSDGICVRCAVIIDPSEDGRKRLWCGCPMSAGGETIHWSYPAGSKCAWSSLWHTVRELFAIIPQTLRHAAAEERAAREMRRVFKKKEKR